MHSSSEQLFYGLSIFVLMTALFVLQKNGSQEVVAFNNNATAQFAAGAIQTFGDQPVFDKLALIFDGVENFYHQTAQAAIALIQDRGADHDLALIFRRTYLAFADLVQKKSLKIAGIQVDPTTRIDQRTFMTEEPLYNIVPSGKFLRASTETPVNSQEPWVTIRDNLTRQLYCLAIYNGEVNKYLGPCKRDYR